MLPHSLALITPVPLTAFSSLSIDEMEFANLAIVIIDGRGSRHQLCTASAARPSPPADTAKILLETGVAQQT
jgi:hypothetical protein